MTPETCKIVTDALARYGATLTETGQIERRGRLTSVRPVQKGKRLRFEMAGGLLSSGPVSGAFVSEFVEQFWFWTPVAPRV